MFAAAGRRSPATILFPYLLSIMEKAEIQRHIVSIYADLAKRSVDRDCTGRTQCCQFRLTGKTPMLTRGEAHYAATGVRASGRKKLPPKDDGSCPLLGKDGLCAIYEHRPFGCRTHFCPAAGGQYPRKTVADLIQRLDALDEKMGGDGPRAIQSAVTDALSRL